jgi:serine/threonine protein kinase
LLLERFHFRELEAEALGDMLSKMLAWEPGERWTAEQLLNHHWLKMVPNYNYLMGRHEMTEYKRAAGLELSPERAAENIDDLSEGGFSDNVQPKEAPARREERPTKIEKIDDDDQIIEPPPIIMETVVAEVQPE